VTGRAAQRGQQGAKVPPPDPVARETSTPPPPPPRARTEPTCPACGGEGFITAEPPGLGYEQGARPCHACGGLATGLTATDLRELAKVRKRLDDLDRQAIALRARRAAILRSLRDGGMTLDEIARHAGVTRATVHQWCR